MKELIGLIIIAVGIVFGIYFGFWVMFIGGAVDIIDAIKAPVTNATAVGGGVLKMVFAGLIGGIIVWVSLVIGGLIGLSGRGQRRFRKFGR